MPHEHDRDRIDDLLDYDCSWGLPGLGRFRVNILRQRGSFMIVMRVIPIEVPSFEDLKLPPILAKIADHERGLILVTGVTGSGKSSTMAAMIGWINAHKQRHIVTLENPIEFLHRDQKSSITQRDIGTDTPSFVAGLRASLRQDLDVLLIGEMRDKEAIDTALKAAETGHLVISTVHTKNAVQTISRLIAVFEPAEQDMVRIRFSEQLQAVVSQRLIPTKDGKGEGTGVRDHAGHGDHPRLHRRPQAPRRDLRPDRGRRRSVRIAELRPELDGSGKERPDRLQGRDGGRE